MKLFTFILLSTPVLAFSWVTSSPRQRTAFVPRTRLDVAADFRNQDGETTDKPCWQDIWSYDCAMSNAYSAAFIPADWIKKLPCALGLAVRLCYQ